MKLRRRERWTQEIECDYFTCIHNGMEMCSYDSISMVALFRIAFVYQGMHDADTSIEYLYEHQGRFFL